MIPISSIDGPLALIPIRLSTGQRVWITVSFDHVWTLSTIYNLLLNKCYQNGAKPDEEFDLEDGEGEN